ncbi:MAG: ABC transporter substrate-binding protein [Chloroflexi bacterium]|nr:ABC transporter substrate-binding protein [Chloroflexota bacterium]MCY3716960.1 ABC transporter substrate-binding protein [Chloroflexota bacterium]MDE2650144.1 ABC transporter substrate-binding protein [Chloroflexota bacterium]MXV92858.1 carbohydrate ABC transporter substrate-binding protein [Chloroflexota bacterium]MXX82352.1 carbohydrate ABC transporter substrate-binding protein [Chloroflexota bacterium]
MKAIGKLAVVFLFMTLTIASSAQSAFPDGTAISLLQWRHFVPRHDEWFDGYAAEWGAVNNVAVQIDRVNFAELPATLAAELEAGAGHTIIELISSSAAFVEGLHDLSDINQRALDLYGEQLQHCRNGSYLPALGVYFSFAHGYFFNHGNYDIALWTQAGFPKGPQTYADLLAGGRAIYEVTGIPLGIGLSPEIDSEMALRELLWSFGGSIQDENENVTLDSAATIAAVSYMAQLQQQAMTAEVFGWTGASNNQALIAGEVSFILNPDSAYRSLQNVDEAGAANIGFTPGLAGPAGAIAGSFINSSVIPAYVSGDELRAAKQFILDLSADYSDATYHSELFNLPCFPAAVSELDTWLESDPFGSVPADKFAVLKPALEGLATLGYPGPSNPAIGQAYGEHIIPNMFAQVALGATNAEEAVAQAAQRVEEIFTRWREKGLIGGGQ